MVLYLLRLLLRLFYSYDKTVRYTILLHWYQILGLENGFISFYKQDNGRLERKRLSWRGWMKMRLQLICCGPKFYSRNKMESI